MSAQVTVLFARKDSVYKTLADCEVYDIDRDARSWPGGTPVVAHPPCRAWGRFKAMAKPRHDEKDLAHFAVAAVRANGGVLEHPAYSSLWRAAGLPAPGKRDVFGGFTLPINQHWFGHRAVKATWLYVCGIEPTQLPTIPIVLGDSTHVIAQMRCRKDGTRMRKGDVGWRPEVSKAERERTPQLMAEWLVELARRCRAEM